MKKLLLASTLILSSLSANERVSQLKAAIVRSDDQAVTQLLTHRSLSAKEIYELCGWADDLIEERNLRAWTVGEEASCIAGYAGIVMLAMAAVGYRIHDEKFMNLLKRCNITTGTRAALSAGGCTLLCLYGIQRGGRAAQERLSKACAIKDVLEQQLVLFRKEPS